MSNYHFDEPDIPNYMLEVDGVYTDVGPYDVMATHAEAMAADGHDVNIVESDPGSVDTDAHGWNIAGGFTDWLLGR